MGLRNIQRVCVVGAGSFGTALADVLARDDRHVSLIGRDPAAMQQMRETGRNPRYLPDVAIASNIHTSVALSDARTADFLVLAVPSHALRDTCRSIAPFVKPRTLIMQAAKGLEPKTGLRMSQVVLEELGSSFATSLVALAGPCHAEELARKLPSTLVVASASRQAAEDAQDALMNRYLRVYTNPDVTGVELGAALKNSIALGCGIADGLQFGDNAKAALMTRGLTEITRLGAQLGASAATFSGLAGIGDLIVTCTSRHSRNWNTGYLLGQGMSLAQALAKVGMAVEGVRTTQVALELARSANIEMPIVSAIAEILFDDKPPHEAVTGLMTRMRTHETEEYVQESATLWQYDDVLQ